MEILVSTVASDTLGGRDEGIVHGKGEERGKEVVGGLDGGSVGKRGGTAEGRDTNTSEASRKVTDLCLCSSPVSVGRAEPSDFAVELSVESLPEVVKVGGEEGALEVTEVLLYATTEEDEGGLERESWKLVDDCSLFFDLVQEEVRPEDVGANGSAKNVDPVFTDVGEGSGD